MYRKVLCKNSRDLVRISPLQSKFFFCTINSVKPRPNFHNKEDLGHRLFPILQACCDHSLLPQARQVHAQLVVSNAIHEKSLLGTKVLAVYVLTGSFLRAKNMFFFGLDLRFASPWNWMIRWFNAMGLFDVALRLYFKMLGYGTFPDKYTFPSVIKACAGLRNLRLAEQVQRRVEVMGLEADMFVGSSLIRLYAENGLVDKARKLFDKMPQRDCVLWNTMLNGYGRNRDVNGSFEMFLGLCRSDLKPNSVAFACMLSICASQELLRFGTQLHSLAVTLGLELDSSVGNTLLALYSKCRRLFDASKLFNLLPQTNPVTWNGMISGFVQNGSMTEASRCFRDMISANVKPDPVTFASFLPCVTESTDLRRGKEIHAYIVRHRVDLDVFLKSALIDLYFKCRDVNMARRILGQSVEIDVIVCTAMISGFVLNGMSAEALKMFRWLIKERMRPNTVTLASVFPAFALLAALRLGKELHSNVLKHGPNGTCYVESSIMDMYAKCGRLDLARRVFRRMSVKDAVCWNTMITSCSQNGKPEEAIEFFRRMRTEEGMEYDSIAVSAALCSCANIPALHHGREIHGFSIRKGLGSDVFSGSSLIDMYSKCGNLGLARRLFDLLVCKNEVSWNSIIAAYGSHGQLEDSLTLFHEMLGNGIWPDHVTFVGILSACGHSGRVDDGVRYFRLMTEEYRIPARMEHYACMVDLFGRAGRLTEACDVIKTMPFSPDAGVWGTLLGACRVYGNVELAEEASRHLFELDPRNSGYYILLSNVHADAGDWESVAKVRGLMKQRGVQKVPGYSWFEINGATRVFVAADESHPESSEIYSALNSLLPELRRLGYVPLPYIRSHPQTLAMWPVTC